MMVSVKQGFLEMVGQADLISQDEVLDERLYEYRQQIHASEQCAKATAKMRDALQSFMGAQDEMVTCLKELGVREKTELGPWMLALAQTETKMTEPLQELLKAHQASLDTMALFQCQVAEDMEETISKFESTRRQYDGYRTELQEAEKDEKEHKKEGWKSRLSQVFGKKSVADLRSQADKCYTEYDGMKGITSLKLEAVAQKHRQDLHRWLSCHTSANAEFFRSAAQVWVEAETQPPSREEPSIGI
eukprot:TRINITY_DN11568_c0_g1_i3.p1 TRINITY_DN11568_c0_g1~~TRINITY_DN11568_c0_g1_i3.p1  ORF type:complete len:246 (+),score=61.71 TRINITY_DN11568_c0_g1_i3:144-881(+)